MHSSHLQVLKLAVDIEAVLKGRHLRLSSFSL